ncbi:MAG: twin-arginine translocation pathway signal protein [Candidatus Saccharibacteria bacterium]|nr:twin-arginine translocation pathway signal protein [Candidatus Saccharibacteria bacterium]
MDTALESVAGVNPDHLGLLNASLRAPSAHNAQPWKIKPLPDGKTYELHYDHNDYLPDDPDDRDAYLTMGAFVETIVLEAPNFNLAVTVTPKLSRTGDDLFVAEVSFSPLAPGGQTDPLSAWVSKRSTNRNHYTKDALTPELETSLKDLGNALVEPKILKDVLTEASMKSWANPRFVHDLKVWYRSDKHAGDGYTSPQMHLSPVVTAALKFAFWRGNLKSKFMERIYSTRDVAMFTAAPKAAVLSATDMSPAALFDAGRRLFRSWVTIIAAGYVYHPFSIAIDEKSTAPQVAKLSNTPVPVALYRIGKSNKPPRAMSNRKPLKDVLLS